MHFKIHPLDARECESCGIRSNSLFADLNSDDFRLIDQMIHETSVPAHTTLFDEGSPGQFLFTIRRGLVKLVRYQTDGSQRIIRLLTPGDIAGLETTATPSYDSTAITLTEVTACRIPQAVIERLEGSSPRLHAQLLRKWHEALKQADDFIADLASGSARQRLARLLLRLSNGDSGHPVLLPAREDVGAMLGITTETASRAVAAFRREGLLQALDRQGRHFRVDAAALGAVAARND
ncbi:MAG TPA: Crp/Fnr family transcriptional regulator [Quisquiliibacterium sp.]|nr:Crp/Fnr family transcriptional regulator [Quisquiliibacterium sp.]